MSSRNKNIAEQSSVAPPAKRRPGRPKKNIIENKNIAEQSSVAPPAKRRPGRPKKNIIENNSDDTPVTPDTSTKLPVPRSSKNIVPDDAPITPNTPTRHSLTKNSDDMSNYTPTKYSLTKNDDDISITPNISAKCPVTRNSNIFAGHSVAVSSSTTQFGHGRATHITSHDYARLDYDPQLDHDDDMSQHDDTNYINYDTAYRDEYEYNSDSLLNPKKSGIEKLNI